MAFFKWDASSSLAKFLGRFTSPYPSAGLRLLRRTDAPFIAGDALAAPAPRLERSTAVDPSMRGAAVNGAVPFVLVGLPFVLRGSVRRSRRSPAEG